MLLSAAMVEPPAEICGFSDGFGFGTGLTDDTGLSRSSSSFSISALYVSKLRSREEMLSVTGTPHQRILL